MLFKPPDNINYKKETDDYAKNKLIKEKPLALLYKSNVKWENKKKKCLDKAPLLTPITVRFYKYHKI